MKRNLVVFLCIAICISMCAFAYGEEIFPCELEVNTFLSLQSLYIDNLAAVDTTAGVDYDTMKIIPENISATETELSFNNQYTGVLYVFTTDGTGIDSIGIYYSDANDYQEIPLTAEGFLIAHSPTIGNVVSKLLISIQSVMTKSENSPEKIALTDGVSAVVARSPEEENIYMVRLYFDVPVTFDWVLERLEQMNMM